MPPFGTRLGQRSRSVSVGSSRDRKGGIYDLPVPPCPVRPSRSGRKQMSAQGIALITGASGGIGAAYAERLARRGYDLALAGRDRTRLNSLAARICDETSRDVQVLEGDLRDKKALASLESFLKEDASVSMLVNSAGIGSIAPLLQSDTDKMEEMIELNISVLVRLSYAA